MDKQQRLNEVKVQLESLRADTNAADRDKLMRTLRKERRKLEDELGLPRDSGRTPTTEGEKKPRKSKKNKETAEPLSPEEQRRRKRQDRKRRQRALDEEDGSQSLAETKYIYDVPDHIWEYLESQGLRDVRQDPNYRLHKWYAFSILKQDADKSGQYLIDKFKDRWGWDPEYFYQIHQGPIHMVCLGPVERIE